MANKLYVYRKGLGVIPAELAPERKDLHYIITDEMPALFHPADNKYYTSKKEFRRTTKNYGYVEVGNDLLSKRKRRAESKPMSEGFKKALWDNIDRAINKK